MIASSFRPSVKGRTLITNGGNLRGHVSHSLRVDAAQDLLCAGFDTAAIMRAGGWKSINVLGRYLEFAEHNVWG